MCCFSACAQIIYGLLMLACAILTAIALFSNGWNNDKLNTSGGLFPWSCFSNPNSEKCGWNNSQDFPSWKKAVAIMMVIAWILELFALVWNLITFFACCCKKYIIHPLAPLALFITLLLLTSVIVFGISDHNAYKDKHLDTSLGWCFWMAVAATVIAAANVVVGAITVCCGESCL